MKEETLIYAGMIGNLMSTEKKNCRRGGWRQQIRGRRKITQE